jgi:hypothetical protein
MVSLLAVLAILLANKIRSKILYNDAFVHLVGLLGAPRYWEVKNRLPQDIRDHVVEEYVNLCHKQMAADHLIFSLFALVSKLEQDLEEGCRKAG